MACEDMTRGGNAIDRLTALLAALFSGLAYFYCLAPEVGLQGSGVLVTGAFTFGVPGVPGVPVWAMLGFLWSHLIVPFGNPAWRLGTLSVALGAATVGVMTLLMIRSTRLLLRSLPWGNADDERLQAWQARSVAVATALLFGFSRGVWPSAVIPEKWILDVFVFFLITFVFFAWTMQPQRCGFLYAAVLFYGLGLGCTATISLLALPIALGTLVVGLDQSREARRQPVPGRKAFGLLMSSLAHFWELGAAGLLSMLLVTAVLTWLAMTSPPTSFDYDDLALGVVAGVAGLILVGTGWFTGWWKARRILAFTGLFALGISAYLYLPLAASTNPPISWGYSATKQGLLHLVTRRQYEQIQPANVFSLHFLEQLHAVFFQLIHQFSLPLALVGLATLPAMGLAWRRWKPRGCTWMLFLWAAFLTSTVGLTAIINPKLDRQEQVIFAVYLASAFGFAAMLIGYGFAALLSFMTMAWRGAVATRCIQVLCLALLALPIIPFQRNRALGDQRGNDFGYLFGSLMFNPGGGYAPMEKGAVLFGGTDPGRFVPTYMIFCESRVAPKDRFRDKAFDRSDVYMLTQNALADNTYMSCIRDQYEFSRPDAGHPETLAEYPPLRRWAFNLGWKLLHRDRIYPKEPIHIPSPEEGNQAFQEYIEDVRSGKIPASADIKIENGRVSVQGVGGVMAINGILARWIFDRNKDKHAFYVEESYVIPWMYPYMRPHGPILKLEKEPLASPQENAALWKEILVRDKAYWDTLTRTFLARADFLRDSNAQKTFSKLRSAIAGLYVSRGLLPEGEYAFRQARLLCPECLDAIFRLADLYIRERRFAEARRLMEAYAAFDKYNRGAQEFLASIRGMERDEQRRIVLEQQAAQGTLRPDDAIDLLRVYLGLNLEPQFQSLASNVVNNASLPPEVGLAAGRVAAASRHWGQAARAFVHYVAAHPEDFRVRIDLAAVRLAQGKMEDAFDELNHAVQSGGEPARALLRTDPRFESLRREPAFQSLTHNPGARVPSLPLPDLF